MRAWPCLRLARRLPTSAVVICPPSSLFSGQAPAALIAPFPTHARAAVIRLYGD